MNADRRKNMRRSKSLRRNKSENKLKRESTSTKHPFVAVPFLIWTGWDMYKNRQINNAKIALMKAQKPIRDEAYGQFEYEINNRTSYFSDLLEKKPEIEHEFKAKVMKKIATFLSLFKDDFFLNEPKKAVLTEYITCYLDEERKDPKSSRDLNPEFRSENVDVVTKFNVLSAKITYEKVNPKVKVLTLSSSIDNLRKEFLRDEIAKFANLDNAKILHMKRNPIYQASWLEFHKNIREMKEPMEPKEVTISEISNLKTRDNNGFIQLETKILVGLDIIQDYTRKANKISLNILKVADRVKTLIEFVENPEVLGKKIKKLNKITEKIKDFGKLNADNLKYVKDFIEANKGTFKKVVTVSGKVLDKIDCINAVLEGVHSLNVNDSPSIVMAKALIVAANLSKLVPYKHPVKTILENVMEDSAAEIQESETLQVFLDHGLTSQAAQIIDLTDRGIIPPMAMNSFADGDTHPRLVDHDFAEVADQARSLVKEKLGPKAEEFLALGQQGIMSPLAQFDDSATVDVLSHHRKEDAIAEMRGYYDKTIDILDNLVSKEEVSSDNESNNDDDPYFESTDTSTQKSSGPTRSKTITSSRGTAPETDRRDMFKVDLPDW